MGRQGHVPGGPAGKVGVWVQKALTIVSGPWPSLGIRCCGQWDKASVPTPIVPTPSKQSQSVVSSGRTELWQSPCWHLILSTASGQNLRCIGLFWFQVLEIQSKQASVKSEQFIGRMLIFTKHNHGNGRASETPGPHGTFSLLGFSELYCIRPVFSSWRRMWLPSVAEPHTW